ncbi:MAG: DJ-1 family glyoxalase III [Opitutales bacterium]
MHLKALICLHPGFEELEAVAVIDLLARAGIDVTQAAVGDDLTLAGRNGMTLVAGCLLAEIPEHALYDVVVVPGGPGIQKIRRHPAVCHLLQRHQRAGKLVACICAAPLLLLDAGLIDTDTNYTAFPATSGELPNRLPELVVKDGRLITSQGAGTATEFALAIIECLMGRNKADEIASSICWHHTEYRFHE